MKKTLAFLFVATSALACLMFETPRDGVAQTQKEQLFRLR